MLALILSIVGVGGVGAAAFAFPPFGALLLGAGKSVLGFLTKIPWQVYAIAAVGLVIVFLFISRGHWMDRAHKAEAAAAIYCTDVRTASGNPKLDCGQAGEQILYLGQALKNTEGELARQNSRIQQLSIQLAHEQSALAAAQKVANAKAKETDTVVTKLETSARSETKATPGCQPSKALEEQWK